MVAAVKERETVEGRESKHRKKGNNNDDRAGATVHIYRDARSERVKRYSRGERDWIFLCVCGGGRDIVKFIRE